MAGSYDMSCNSLPCEALHERFKLPCDVAMLFSALKCKLWAMSLPDHYDFAQSIRIRLDDLE